jgi:hypothetical protein
MKSAATKTLTRLKVTDERGFEKTILIDKDVFPLGREASAGLVLTDGHDEQPGTIAACHALIIRDGESYILKDQAGSCGTRVNGRPIRSTVLKHADEIRLGSSSLRIQFLIEGTRASDHEEARIRQLLEALRELHASPETREVCARAAAAVMGLTGSTWAAVTLRNASNTLEMVAAVDRAGNLPDAPSAIAQHVANTARSYFHPARLCVPVMGTDGLLGVIDAGPREARPYQAGEMNLLEALASHVGVALANARRMRMDAPLPAQEAAAS